MKRNLKLEVKGMQIKTILIVAMLCLAMAGIAVAPGTPVPEPEECCWAEPCGTLVEECDQETTFVLNHPDCDDVKIIVNGGQWFYVDMNCDGIVSYGDVRLTGYHDEYGPNTKVLSGDDDNFQGATVLTYQHIITYWDINDNEMYDLYDPVYVDVDDDGAVSVGDIRITDVPPVDVYSLENADLGELVMEAGDVNDADNQRWSVVTSANDVGQQDKGMDLEHIGNGYIKDLIGYVDVDASGDWTCPDKLYINQPAPECAEWFDATVTIGDVRLYIPAYDEHSPNYDLEECVPECGTKVTQGDADTTYALIITDINGFNADLAYDADYPDMNQIYVDMDHDGIVSFGDIRISEISTTYPPNTKVGPSNMGDLNNELIDLPSQNVSFSDIDGLPGYSIGDPLYLDITEPFGEVSAGDLRLNDVPVFAQDGFMPGDIGMAYTFVEAGQFSEDLDVGNTLEFAGTFDDLVGFIDSDCTGDWTCPDKLYLQQLFEERENGLDNVDVCYSPDHYDWFVTVGDDRLYVPVNDPYSPFFEMEDWPDCATKVRFCDIDAGFALKNIYVDVGFIDRNKDGLFDQNDAEPGMADAAYLDMDRNMYVSIGDIRLNDFTISGVLYEANTKVAEHDEDLRFQKPLKPQGNAELNDITDPDYTEDTLLVDYQGTYIVFNTTDQVVGWFDADCSGSWTCVDALFLQDLVEASPDDVEEYLLPVGTLVYDVTAGIDGDFEDLAVTHMDFRLFIEPSMICDGEVPDNGCDYNEFDANQNYIIEFSEVSAAIDDFIAGDIDFSVVSGLIDLFKLDGPYCE
jgi:hypothetical protein